MELDPELMKSEEPVDHSEKEKILREEIKKIDSQRAKFLDLYGSGLYSMEELEKRIKPLTEQKNRISVELESMEGNLEVVNQKKKLIQSMDDFLNVASHDEIRKIILALIEKIEIDDDDIYIHWSF